MMRGCFAWHYTLQQINKSLRDIRAQQKLQLQ